MKRLTAYVSGWVPEVGYGRMVARLAVAFGLCSIGCDIFNLIEIKHIGKRQIYY
jgi:hypothetical protein